MPRMRCPGCQRILQVEESSRGDTVRCPLCRRLFGVARRPEDDEPLDAAAPYQLKNEPDAPRPVPPPGEEDDDRPPIRRSRKRRRRKGEADLPDFLAQWNLDKILLVGSVGLWFVLLGLALMQNGFSIGLFAAGLVLVLLARVWASLAASEEGGSGCLMLLSPWYYLITLFELEDRRPLFLFGVGIVYLLTGLALLSIFYVR